MSVIAGIDWASEQHRLCLVDSEGRRLLERAIGERKDFAFETTLASRNFAPWLRTLKGQGFRVHVTFLSLPTADLAVARVAERVRQGGMTCPRT